MLLPHAAVWRLDLVVAEDARPARWADALHSRLGPALHDRACALACGQGPCLLGRGCAFWRGYEEQAPGGRPRPRPWRIDTSDLDQDLEPAVRVAVFDRADEGTLLAALPDALLPHALRGLAPLAHGGDHAPATTPGAGLDLAERAEELVGHTLVELRSPVRVKRGNEVVADPSPRDLLHATRHRARDLGLDLAALPHFEDEIAVLDGHVAPAPVLHRSRRQPRPGVLAGTVGAWRLDLTPAQAAWIALAEVLGVGGKTALGHGVLRASPLG